MLVMIESLNLCHAELLCCWVPVVCCLLFFWLFFFFFFGTRSSCCTRLSPSFLTLVCLTLLLDSEHWMASYAPMTTRYCQRQAESESGRDLKTTSSTAVSTPSPNVCRPGGAFCFPLSLLPLSLSHLLAADRTCSQRGAFRTSPFPQLCMHTAACHGGNTLKPNLSAPCARWTKRQRKKRNEGQREVEEDRRGGR